MRKLIRQLPLKHAEKVNWGLIDRTVDDSISDIIRENMESLNIIENVKIVRTEFNDDPSDTDNKIITVRRDRKKFPNVKYIGQSRLGCLTLYFHVVGTDGNSTERKQAIIVRKILIPLLDERNQILLQGKNYNLIYQLVDKTLYPTASAVTIKSLLPICIKIYETTITDMHGKEYETFSHLIQIFKKFYNPLYLSSLHGIDYILKLMEVDLFIQFHRLATIEIDDPNYLFFQVDNIVIRVYKDAFDKFTYIQSVVTMIIELLDAINVTWDTLRDENFWLLVFSDGKPEKARSNRIFHSRMLDITTQRKLFIDKYNKFTIHHLVRYTIMNFQKLWAYDNLSFDNKRLRCAEYIGSILTGEISKRMNRATILGPRATFDDYVRVISFHPDLLIKKMHSAGILRYDEIVNDMDIVSKLRYTKKGRSDMVGPFPTNCGNVSLGHNYQAA